jgi:L-lactate dehydrogenase complex protein LldG
MSAVDNGRHAVLRRIRSALGVANAGPARLAAVDERLRRHLRGTIPARARADQEASLALMTTMLAAQGADVTRARTEEDALRAIAEDLDAHGLPAVLPMGTDPVLAALPWASAPALMRRIGRAEPHDRAALSRAVSAAAETGTLILTSGRDNPTTLAFLPETHFILIRAADVAGSYEEAFDRLRAIYGEGHLPRTVNLISGPSRTADIEQTIVRGAHGPKRLHVVILG